VGNKIWMKLQFQAFKNILILLNGNEEISINTIYTTTEPIVEKCKRGLISIIEAHDNYFQEKFQRATISIYWNKL